MSHQELGSNTLPGSLKTINMNLFALINKVLNNKTETTETPDGYCPTCWGRQEYGGKFYDAVHKEGINLNNISSKKGWITAYVEQHLEGIKFNTSKGAKACPSCQITYKQA